MNMTKDKRTQLKALISTFVVGLIVLAVILVLIGPEQTWLEIKQANPWFFVLAIGMQILSSTTLFVRWRYFINAAGQKVPALKTFLISISGLAVNSITPAARIGGEPLKAFLLKKKCGVRLGCGIASLVVEKITDLSAFCLISLVAILYSFYVLDVPMHILLVLIAAFLFTASLLASLYYVSFGVRIKSGTIVNLLNKNKWLLEKLPVLKHYKEKMEDSLLNYYSNIFKIGTHPNVWITGIVVSLIGEIL